MKKVLLILVGFLSFSVANAEGITVSEFLELEMEDQDTLCLEYVKLGVASGKYNTVKTNLISRDEATATGYAMSCSLSIAMNAEGNESMKAYDLWLLKDTHLER